MHTVLAIETSCDETAVSIARCDTDSAEILSNEVSSQVKLHAEYGGVVPNLAAREHVKNMLPVLDKALKDAACAQSDIAAIAVTNGPGLIPALLVGTSAARTLSWLWRKPLLGVHHIEGHIYANFIGESQKSKVKSQKSEMQFPLLALVVSGGHTQLVLMRKHFQYEIVGETQDDAVGEAFDKVARILSLGYPGGPSIAKAADQVTRKLNNQKTKDSSLSHVTGHMSLALPRPMINSPDFNFSFSGLKTAVLYAAQKMSREEMKKRTPEICAEFQQAAIDVLVSKTLKAAKKYIAKTVLLAGGVSANIELRKQLSKTISSFLPDVTCHLSPVTYSTDNAAMIASAAGIRYARMSQKERANLKNTWRTLETRSDLKLQ